MRSAKEYDAARNRLPAARNGILPASDAENLMQHAHRLKEAPETRQYKRAARKNRLPLIFNDLCKVQMHKLIRSLEHLLVLHLL